MSDTVRERFAEVRSRVDAAAAAAGRDSGGVRVLVATKYVAAEHLGALRDAGIRLIGENRAQDLVAKHELYGDAFDYHFIGHLQSRKTRLVLPIVSLIHSVSQHERRAGDRGPRRERHRRAAGGQHRRRGEQERRTARGDRRVSRAGGGDDKVRFSGLMCMPPLFDDAEQARPYFARARELAQRLSARWGGTYTLDQLSMGTSADYEVAVQEGATIVRVGSVLF